MGIATGLLWIIDGCVWLSVFGQSCARTRKSAETRHHVFLSTLKFRQKKTGSPSSLIFNQLTVHPLSSS